MDHKTLHREEETLLHDRETFASLLEAQWASVFVY